MSDALRELLEQALRARFGINQDRAEDEGFSEAAIGEIMACIWPNIAAALEQKELEIEILEAQWDAMEALPSERTCGACAEHQHVCIKHHERVLEELAAANSALAEKDAQIAAHIRGYARICEVAANNLHRAEVAEAALEAELRDLAADAMTAQSDPHASAAEYRKALIAICNRALARLRETPAPPQEPT